MYGWITLLSTLTAFPFVFPEKSAFLLRKARRWLRDDIRQRVSDEQWEEIKDEFADL